MAVFVGKVSTVRTAGVLDHSLSRVQGRRCSSAAMRRVLFPSFTVLAFFWCLGLRWLRLFVLPFPTFLFGQGVEERLGDGLIEQVPDNPRILGLSQERGSV